MVPILVAIAVGTALGVPAARRVAMTQMPQLVALFNGVGGAAAALVAALELTGDSGSPSYTAAIAGAFTVLVGAVSFSGSVRHVRQAAGADDHPAGRLPGRPAADGRRPRAVGVGLGVGVVRRRPRLAGVAAGCWCCSAWSRSLVGVLFVLPVGGADVPIVISLLNAFTGLDRRGQRLRARQRAAAGRRHAGRRERHDPDPDDGRGDGPVDREHPVRRVQGRLDRRLDRGEQPAGALGQRGGRRDPARRTPARSSSCPATGWRSRRRSTPSTSWSTCWRSKGIQVVYGIHPVAGRMPGHMNVLLAEANVPYEQLKEMDEVNSELSSTDVALVVGANDVVNPAAKTSPGSPIYGMPILTVGDAKAVVFLKRSMRPGLRRHRERAALRARHDAAVRRRQGLAHQGAAVPQDPLDRGLRISTRSKSVRSGPDDLVERERQVPAGVRRHSAPLVPARSARPGADDRHRTGAPAHVADQAAHRPGTRGSTANIPR